MELIESIHKNGIKLNKWYGNLKEHTIHFIMDKEIASKIALNFKIWEEASGKVPDDEDYRLHSEWFPLLFDNCPFTFGGTILNFEFDNETGISKMTLELDDEFSSE